ncbi:MAG: putative signal transducing protein [Planctomycetota bacterium]
MSDKLVTIKNFTNEPLASLAQQVLADNGIEAILSGQNAANIYSGLSDVFDVELQVREDNAEKALEILESMEKSKEQ